MHPVRFLCVLFAFTTLLSGCSKESREANEAETPSSEVVHSDFYTPDDFARYAYPLERVSIEGEEILLELLKRTVLSNNASLDRRMHREGDSLAWGYRTFVLNYRSTDADGLPVMLSELVITPDGETWRFHPDKIVVGNHYSILTDRERPTGPLSDPMTGVASRGAAFICPDLEGYGASADRPHPYLIHDVVARQTVDGILAALDLLEQTGNTPQEDFRLFNVGYSLGGSYALAVHRYIETCCTASVRKKIHLSATRCGGGSYSPQHTFEWLLGQETFYYCAVLPVQLNALLRCNPDLLGQWELKDFFSEAFLKSGVVEKALSKQYTSVELIPIVREATGNRIREILAPEVLDPDSPIRSALDKALSRSDLSAPGWAPIQPVYMYHAVNDDYCPYNNAERCRIAYSGSNFHLYPLPMDASFSALINPHLIGGALFYLQLLLTDFR